MVLPRGAVCVAQSSGSPGTRPRKAAAASPENLIEMQVPGPTLTVGARPAVCV